ncbi:extensin family protein [Pseudomonas nicosulfuronedens]|uniref:extensin-like domain-containing protein n=1 Tax=Pseudomonas TaxID=286 RepID=UPI001486650C|nr:extensin family protein [Pseudomonas nicosulfuronedens]MDH1007241.1 extensin family protein [Pseudomonas nicosulfuronedens]MDH1982086.1 extensin family protein [Pseudomonas nicosulfuronedens]MDH2026336.1 extensin family protein [Pseudomonas nicosulfuronedens]
MRGWLLGFGLVIAGFALAVQQQWLKLPDRWSPWAPLNVSDEPNLLTRYKLWRLRDDAELCRLALQSSDLKAQPMADSEPVAGCPLQNVWRVQAAEVKLSSSFLASCPLAVSFALFERYSLQPAARSVYGQSVVGVEHLGSFACRNIYGRTEGRRSQHASANALDIAAFRLADGRRIVVARDWNGEGDAARFLRAVRDSACGNFDGVLGPDYNRAHHDHFHFDLGGWQLCR